MLHRLLGLVVVGLCSLVFVAQDYDPSDSGVFDELTSGPQLSALGAVPATVPAQLDRRMLTLSVAQDHLRCFPPRLDWFWSVKFCAA
jgi:hypothetical protein